MRRGSWVGALLLVAVGLVVAIRWSSRTDVSDVPQPRPASPVVHAPETVSALAPVPAQGQHDDATTDAATSARVEAPTAPVEPASTRVTCRVLEDSDRKPVADA